MNTILIGCSNIPVMIISFTLVTALFYKIGYGKKALLYALLFLPALYFSTNMLTDALTIDETGYMRNFSNPLSVEVGSTYWNKGTNQYRFTEMLMCTFFRIWRHFQPYLEENTVFAVYKALHYFQFFGVILLTVYVWSKYVVKASRDSVNYRISNLGILYVLTGMPMSCLLLKVCNYDAGSVLFAVLSIILMFAAERKDSTKLAYLAVLASTGSIMEKWTNQIYWCISVSVFAYFVMKKYDKGWKQILHSVKAVALSLVSTAAVFTVSIIYIRVIYGRGIIDISFERAITPMYYLFTFFGRFLTNHIGDSSNDLNVWIYVLIIFVFLLLLAYMINVFMFIIKWIDKNANNKKGKGRNRYSIIVLLNTIITLLAIAGAVYAAYFVPRYGAGSPVIQDTWYVPNAGVNGNLVYFDSNNALLYWIKAISDEFGIVFSYLPTVMLILIAVSVVVMLYFFKDEYLLQTFILGTNLLIIGYAILMVGGRRYLAIPMLTYCIVAIFYIGQIDLEKVIQKKRKKLVYATFGVIVGGYCIEMLLSLPVVSAFSPLWIIRAQDFMDTVRIHESALGEAMTWGEEMAVAGKMIESFTSDISGIEEYGTIYSDYGGGWISNPGFEVIRWKNRNENQVLLDENTWFLFIRYNFTRYGWPNFIDEVEPYARIKFNGQTGAWLYRGDQLVEYAEIIMEE